MRHTMCVAAISAAFLPVPVQAADDSVEAKAIFRRRCTACHTYGKGTKVGPDLKGVTERRKQEWLIKFIASSKAVIESGDSTALELFRKFKPERMPDWKDDLTLQQIEAVLRYFAADGPLQKEPDERHAITATAAEIEHGRRLFHGETRPTYGGNACRTCHGIGASVPAHTGTLASNLSGAYVKYQDRALTDFLKRPCSIRHPETSMDRYLTPQESFNLKAYLAQMSGLAIPAPGNPAQPKASGGTQ